MSQLLQEQWRQPLADAYVRNGPVLNALVTAADRNTHIIELVGPTGSGKSTLLKALTHDHPCLFPGGVEYLTAGHGFEPAAAEEMLADRFRTMRGRGPLIVDGVEQRDADRILDSIRRLESGPWQFTTILTARMPFGLGTAISIPPLNFRQMAALLEAQLGGGISDDALLQLMAASQGVPGLAAILGEAWRSGRIANHETLASLFNPLAVPGLVDPRGRPLAPDSHEERTIVSDVRFVSDALLKAVREDPALVHAPTPREFEELCAELFQRQGYNVSITPQTRDGGKDLYLAKADGFGSFLFIVECKRLAPERPVDVGIVRALYGVASTSA